MCWLPAPDCAARVSTLHLACVCVLLLRCITLAKRAVAAMFLSRLFLTGCAWLPLCARSRLSGNASRKDCAAVILYAAEAATRMALQAIQILGGNGCVAGWGRSRTEGCGMCVSVLMASSDL
jgi:alkylation response protein AidB-like acyl-CoA dehydrogenase